MKTRTDLLNFLAEKYKLDRYLEIGVQDPAQNFDKIICKHKYSVDPDPGAGATFQMTSDAFFFKYAGNVIEKNIYDLVFIDGLHTAEQVKRDFINATMLLSEKGFIVLHDCNPVKEEHTIVPRPKPTGHWNGDVYKFAIQIDDKRTVDIDNGCLVWRSMFGYILNDIECTWTNFDINRKELLNLISWDEFITSHS